MILLETHTVRRTLRIRNVILYYIYIHTYTKFNDYIVRFQSVINLI